MTKSNIYYGNQKLIKYSSLINLIKRLEHKQGELYGTNIISFETVLQLVGDFHKFIIKGVKYIKNEEYLNAKKKAERYMII